MAISNILPVASSVLAPGDSFSFDIDDTYTSMRILVEKAAGTATAYDSTLGGAQSGYTVVVADDGAGTHTFTVSCTAGWDESPFTVSVIENETGSSATTTTTYYLTSLNAYPQSTEPYFGAYTGSLVITDNGVEVRTDAGWVDLVGFTVLDQGNGKVRVASNTLSGGGGAFGAWNLNSTSSTNPSTGEFSVNSSLPGSVTVIEVHDTDSNARTHTGVMAAVPKGSVIALIDGTEYFLYQVISQSPSASYTSFSVGFLAATSGSTFSVDSDYTVSFSFNTNDHGTLSGLADDDHTQYHNDTRGDVRYYTKTQLDVSLGLKADAATALETDEAGEIAGLTEKTTPAANDIFIIEDSADSNNKKKVKYSNLSTGSGTDTRGLGVWTCNSVTSINPSAGQVSLDTSAPASVSSIKIHDQGDGADYGAPFGDLQDNDYIVLKKVGVSVPRGTYRISSVSAASSITTISIDFVDGSGGTFSISDEIEVQIIKGPIGPSTPGTTIAGQPAVFSTTDGGTLVSGNVFIGQGTATESGRTIGTNTALVGGYLEPASGSTIVASGAGAVALGSSESIGTFTSSGSGSFVAGRSYNGGVNEATGNGSVTFGETLAGTLSSTQPGAMVVGQAYVSGLGTATISNATGANGSLTIGQTLCASNGTATITNSAEGGFCGGRAFQNGAGTSSIAASEKAAFAFGRATAGGTISATGTASVAWGDANGTTISATADGAVQFGPGTNAQANSLQVGDTTDGIRLTAGGSAPGTPHNGDIYCDGTDVFIRSGGVWKNVSNI